MPGAVPSHRIVRCDTRRSRSERTFSRRRERTVTLKHVRASARAARGRRRERARGVPLPPAQRQGARRRQRRRRARVVAARGRLSRHLARAGPGRLRLHLRLRAAAQRHAGGRLRRRRARGGGRAHGVQRHHPRVRADVVGQDSHDGGRGHGVGGDGRAGPRRHPAHGRHDVRGHRGGGDDDGVRAARVVRGDLPGAHPRPTQRPAGRPWRRRRRRRRRWWCHGRATNGQQPGGGRRLPGGGQRHGGGPGQLARVRGQGEGDLRRGGDGSGHCLARRRLRRAARRPGGARRLRHRHERQLLALALRLHPVARAARLGGAQHARWKAVRPRSLATRTFSSST